MTRKILVLLSAVAALASCAGSNNSPPAADERVSGQERGGGDDTGLEFNQALQQAVAELKTFVLPEAAGVNFAVVDQKVASVSVLVVTEPLQTKKDNAIQESVAANDPSKVQILVNRSRWHDLVGSGLRKALALHEVLSIAGYEATGRYPISTAYLIKLGITNDPTYLDSAATCVQTVSCAMKEPMCAFIPYYYDHGSVDSHTDLNMYGRISVTCTDHAGHSETTETIGGFRFGTYIGGSDNGQSACAGILREVAYATPRCPGF